MVNKSTLLIEDAAMCSAIFGCACVADNQGITPPPHTYVSYWPIIHCGIGSAMFIYMAYWSCTGMPVLLYTYP